jgi:NitT/TauT family transport system substrate-binding protein
MVAFLRGVRAFNQGKTARNLEIIRRHTTLDEALLRDACWPVVDPDGRVNVDSILEFQSWAVDRGLLDRELTRTEIAAPRFAEAAVRHLDGAPSP